MLLALLIIMQNTGEVFRMCCIFLATHLIRGMGLPGKTLCSKFVFIEFASGRDLETNLFFPNSHFFFSLSFV